MNDGFAFIDIIILAAVAAFLVLKLRSVLGKRSGHDERRGGDPFQKPGDQGDDDKVIPLPNRSKGREEPAASSDAGDDDQEPQEDEGALAANLAKIGLADRTFDPEGFNGGARAAFEIIVTAFAEGNRKGLRPLLSDEVYENFVSAIDAREEREETLETALVGIHEAEIIEASLDQKIAYVTIKFVSEQVNVVRGADGEEIDDTTKQAARITDIWTFARNTRSRDPNWSLVATSSPN